MPVPITGVLVPSDPNTPPSRITLGPEKMAFLRSSGKSERGLCHLVALHQPAGNLCVYREDSALPVNSLASLILRAADPERRQDRVRGDAVLVGVARGDDYESAPSAFTDVLLGGGGRFGVEFLPPQGGTPQRLSYPEWDDVTSAYREGLRLGRALPRMAVRVVRLR
ncbi:hypothetical protein E0F15_11125 [Frankia sp. B2]|uniref:hypothetical protein n=1 Tax=Frankia sp. B2 TaxID=2541730 RepID=UPI0010693011|nr:hypothetical protein [Frankia sp. B2]TFE31027.1 hypothetical protein E0F15_11125 [Frankia sp. B2]